MRRALGLLAVVLALATATPALAMPSDALQCVRVVTPAWSATRGSLQRFERPSARAAWQAVGAAVPVLVGRRGLAWGTGLHPSQGGEPLKHEGDGCSPAGLFRLSQCFGDASAAEVLDAPGRLPFVRVGPGSAAVDDPASPMYNRIVKRPASGPAPWKSAERMDIPEYRVGIVVEHNPAARPGLGSCIFIHIQTGEGVPTSGCTALRMDEVRMLAAWLRRDAHPVLAQMPREAYASRRAAWGLP